MLFDEGIIEVSHALQVGDHEFSARVQFFTAHVGRVEDHSNLMVRIDLVRALDKNADLLLKRLGPEGLDEQRSIQRLVGHRRDHVREGHDGDFHVVGLEIGLLRKHDQIDMRGDPPGRQADAQPLQIG